MQRRIAEILRPPLLSKIMRFSPPSAPGSPSTALLKSRRRISCGTRTWRCTEPNVEGKARHEVFEPSMDAKAVERLIVGDRAQASPRTTAVQSLLPTHRGTGERQGRWGRGVGPLGAPAAGTVAARGVPFSRRGDGSDRADRAMGAPRCQQAGTYLARALP